MNLTNIYGLPKALERFVAKNEYDSGGADFSVTTLIDSPQVARLKNLHEHEITEDVSDMVLSLLGTAVHYILSEGAPDDAICERRFFKDVNGVSISGAIDLMTPVKGEDNLWELRDYKSISGSVMMYNEKGKPEWEKQLNLYKLLAEDAGYRIKDIGVIAFVRDWSHAKVRRDQRFPKKAAFEQPLWSWSREETEEYLQERVRLHTASEVGPCTPEERWQNDKTHAVHEYLANGSGLRKNAKRLFDNSFDAENYIIENNMRAEVLTRMAPATRCMGDYCRVSQFCQQYKDEI